MRWAAAVVVLLVVVSASALAWRQATLRRERTRLLSELNRLPAPRQDFTTPEGAILCLNHAYRQHDIEAAVAAKDFRTEARLLLGRTGFGDEVTDEMASKTADGLESSFRSHTTTSWPNLEGVQSFFPEKEPRSKKVVVVTEIRVFPDNRITRQRILVVETANGWRVVNPIAG